MKWTKLEKVEAELCWVFVDFLTLSLKDLYSINDIHSSYYKNHQLIFLSRFSYFGGSGMRWPSYIYDMTVKKNFNIPRGYFWRRWWHPTPVLLPGKSHGQRSLVSCSPWGHKESDTTERLHFHFSFSCIGEGNGTPLQYSCLENPRDGRAWWAAVYGVAQSWTRLKWLSSSAVGNQLRMDNFISTFHGTAIFSWFQMLMIWNTNAHLKAVLIFSMYLEDCLQKINVSRWCW